MREIFSTLTAPNCTGEEISFELDRFNKAVKKLFKRRNVAHFFKGCIRKLEVTTGQEQYIPLLYSPSQKVANL
ncbi:protein rep [Psychrobacillus sp. FSL K6-4046]|uniref:protein rep n=1 Tax=Psychrobacillus sp. FSL K6-4046 TaxID=2921550 RepID=UPI00315B1A1E